MEGLQGLGAYRGMGRDGDVDIAVPRFPGMANFDDLDALVMEEGVGLRFIDRPSELGSPSAVLLPGSKTTLRDLAWLRETGLADAFLDLAAEAVPVTGICGGYQMLGKEIDDTAGIESGGGCSPGLGLLNVRTVFTEGKQTRPVQGKAIAGAGRGDAVTGYEIHMGETHLGPGASSLFELHADGASDGKRDGAVSDDSRVWGTYLHGVFDQPEFRRSWLESIGWRRRGAAKSLSVEREAELDRLADTVEEATDMVLLNRIIGIA